MRAGIRVRLGDVGAPPLWDDPTLNEAIADALRGYGARVPRERTTSVDVAAGARRIALPPEAVRVLRVVDPAGRAVDRWPADHGPVAAAGQAWRGWDGGVSLAEPAQPGTWRIDSLGPRSEPADDAADLDIVAGDEAAVGRWPPPLRWSGGRPTRRSGAWPLSAAARRGWRPWRGRRRNGRSGRVVVGSRWADGGETALLDDPPPRSAARSGVKKRNRPPGTDLPPLPRIGSCSGPARGPKQDPRREGLGVRADGAAPRAPSRIPHSLQLPSPGTVNRGWWRSRNRSRHKQPKLPLSPRIGGGGWGVRAGRDRDFPRIPPSPVAGGQGGGR
jgi:hypothetical protein